ncbi:BZ3500_MvSof-1268-A1-R1_Chr1-3g02418 [Microbotryum saponariae]|uniref:BZ3500_MvSof-1268-A1-R1_Chr1-3g02418 protein n=1 Tax=Microbotryum saponariae TaxID=289078 RepID=A0A2X0MVJ2_9BASI|nr:BZ3500_MvSof-1268-A1-R1_Chr1-3g02418 [Microbotryum saponariae]SCZ96205.1 BZ3501_MvSof-1269-A2-R1_Chr1-3g02021 [Microbotryum saponariae]
MSYQPITLDSIYQHATQVHEKRLAALVKDRHEQLASLYYAMQDKSRATSFEAGLRTLATANASNPPENHNPLMTLDKFQRDFSDATT